MEPPNLTRPSRTTLDQYPDDYQPIRSRKWMLDVGAVPDLSEATDQKQETHYHMPQDMSLSGPCS